MHVCSKGKAKDKDTDIYKGRSSDGGGGGSSSSDTYPLRVGLLGDVGQTHNSSATRDHMIAHDPHVIFFAGGEHTTLSLSHAIPLTIPGGGGLVAEKPGQRPGRCSHV